MRMSWGVGALVSVLLGVVVFLFGILSLEQSISLMLLLVGLWTVAVAFTAAESKDRSYYSGWGVVIAFLSLFAYIPFNYTLGLLLLAVVALILLNVFMGRAPKTFTAATNPPRPAGETPAAKAYPTTS